VPPRRRVNVRDLVTAAEEPEAVPSPRRSLLPGLARAVLGSTPRFLSGAFLLAVGLLWLNARDLIPGSGRNDDPVVLWERSLKEPPLDLFGVPESVMRALCSLNAAVAGLLLVVSAIWRSPKMGAFLLPAGVLMVAGPALGVPGVGPLSPPLLCLAAGAALALLGFLFGKDT
jgi:hypothetical protein